MGFLKSRAAALGVAAGGAGLQVSMLAHSQELVSGPTFVPWIAKRLSERS